MHQTLQLLSLTLTCVKQITASSCTPEIQSSILSSIPQCTTRPTLVDLRTEWETEEDTDVLQLIPDHVMVERCAGSCYIPAHRCNPTKTSVKKVPVMMVMNQWPHGEHEMSCSDVEVEVHEECACGCDLNQDDCLPGLQYFHPQSCRCVCGNVEERAACILTGKVWDPASCRCHCPSHTWQACSSGYSYDYTDTCSCQLIHDMAGNSALLAVVILSAALVLTILGGILMFRTRTGIFKEMRIKLIEESESAKEAGRTRLMTQKSKVEFESVNNSLNVPSPVSAS